MLLLRGAWLALIAGSADAAGWVLSGIFTAHITGNTVLLGVSLAQGDFGKAAIRAVTVAGAFAGFSVAAALLRQDTRARRRATGPLASGLALLAALMGHTPYDIVLLAAALAAANFAYQNFEGTSVNIGFLTGDLQSLASALFGPKKDRTKTRVIPVVWVFYVAGGCCDGVLRERARASAAAGDGGAAGVRVESVRRKQDWGFAPDPTRIRRSWTCMT